MKNMAFNLAQNIESDKPEMNVGTSKYQIQINQVKSSASSGAVSIPGKLTTVTIPSSSIPIKGAVSVINGDKNSLSINAK